MKKKYLCKVWAEMEKEEMIKFLEHLKDEHGFIIGVQEDGNEKTYYIEHPTGIYEGIAKEINQD